MQLNTTILNPLLKQNVKVILSFPNGQLITYFGELQDYNDQILMLLDERHGLIALNVKDISQILPWAGGTRR